MQHKNDFCDTIIIGYIDTIKIHFVKHGPRLTEFPLYQMFTAILCLLSFNQDNISSHWRLHFQILVITIQNISYQFWNHLWVSTTLDGTAEFH